MAILHGRDIFSAKYLTAMITDSENRVHFVAIKHTVGDYFVTEIDNQFYVFSLKGARELIYRQTTVKSFRVVQYDTSNFMSVKAEAKELELLLETNGLPKVDNMLYSVLKTMARREKKKFEPHDIGALIKQYSGKQEELPEQFRNIKKYLDELGVETIVTPCRRVTDFLESDFVATSPSFLGNMIDRIQRLDNEHRKITNTPISGNGGILKLAVIVLLIGVVGAGGFIAYDNGAFDGIMSTADSFSTIGQGLDGLGGLSGSGEFGQIQRQAAAGPGAIDYSDAALMAKYPEPVDMKRAIVSGELDYDKLSTFMQGLVDDVETPNEIELPPPTTTTEVVVP